MKTSARFLAVLQPAEVSIPSPFDLQFDGVLLTFDALSLTFNPT